MVFDMGVLNRWRVVPALDLDQAGLLNGFLVISDGDATVSKHIVRPLLVEDWSALFFGFERIEDEGVFFVFNFDGSYSTVRRDIVPGDDHGNLVAIITDVLVKDLAVCDVLFGRIGCPRVPCRRPQIIGGIETGENLDDTINFLSFSCVDFQHPAMRNGRMENPRYISVLGTEIIRVFRAAGRLVVSIDALRTFPNFHR